MTTNKMFYEEATDLIVKLRPYISVNRTKTPFANVILRKYEHTLNEDGTDVLHANPLLDAYLNGRKGLALLIVADVLHNLKLTVSFEMFKRETGFDPFCPQNACWASEEINRFRSLAGDRELTALIEPLMWFLAESQGKTIPIEGVWEDLGINPKMIHDLKHGAPAEPQYDDDESFKSNMNTNMNTTMNTNIKASTPKKIPLYQRVSSVVMNVNCDLYKREGK